MSAQITGSPPEQSCNSPDPSGSRRSVIVRGTLITAIVGLGVGIFAGCGSSSDALTGAAASPMGNMAMATSVAAAPAASATDQARSAAVIHISKFMFRPPASVAAGSTVGVMNMDTEAHTVTADAANAFDVKAAPGAMTTFTAPTKPGTYKFHCTYHSNMHGVLVVK
jgi:plastocyanin